MKSTFFDYLISFFFNGQKPITMEDITDHFSEFNRLGLLPGSLQATNIITGDIKYFPQLTTVDKKWQVNITDQRIDIHFNPVSDFITNADVINEFYEKSFTIIDSIMRISGIAANRVALNSSFTANWPVNYAKYLAKSSMLFQDITEWSTRYVSILNFQDERINVILEVSYSQGTAIPLGNMIRKIDGTMYHFDINTRQELIESRFNLENYKDILNEIKRIRSELITKIWSGINE